MELRTHYTLYVEGERARAFKSLGRAMKAGDKAYIRGDIGDNPLAWIIHESRRLQMRGAEGEAVLLKIQIVYHTGTSCRLTWIRGPYGWRESEC